MPGQTERLLYRKKGCSQRKTRVAEQETRSLKWMKYQVPDMLVTEYLTCRVSPHGLQGVAGCSSPNFLWLVSSQQVRNACLAVLPTNLD